MVKYMTKNQSEYFQTKAFKDEEELLEQVQDISNFK